MLNNNKLKIIDNKIDELNNQIYKCNLTKSLKENINIMNMLFKDDDIFIMREIRNNNDKKLSFILMYSNGLVNSRIINESIIKPLMETKNIDKNNILEYLEKHVIQIDQIKISSKFSDIVKDVTYGDLVLFVDGSEEALIMNTKILEKRYITEPENEKNLTGPREGFTEIMLTNLALIRRKVRTNELKFKTITLGDKTNTQVCICYIDSIVDKDLVRKLEKKIKINQN